MCVIFGIRVKLKGGNDGLNLVIFAYISVNVAVISNTRDSRTLAKQNLVSDLCFAAVRCSERCSSINKL